MFGFHKNPQSEPDDRTDPVPEGEITPKRESPDGEVPVETPPPPETDNVTGNGKEETPPVSGDAPDGDPATGETPNAPEGSDGPQFPAEGYFDVQFEKLRTTLAGDGEAVKNEMLISFARLDEKAEKLLNLYDLMTEYKKQNSLMASKLADFYERMMRLRLFCEQTFQDQSESSISLQKRVSSSEVALRKILNSCGIIPIFPLRNDEFNPDEHELMGEEPRTDEGDLPEHICECCKMGFSRDGIVISPAQVTIFKTAE